MSSRKEKLIHELLQKRLGEVRTTKLEGLVSEACELEAPVDLPWSFLHRTKILDVSKDRKLFSHGGRFNRGPGYGRMIRGCEEWTFPAGCKDAISVDHISGQWVAQDRSSEPAIDENASGEHFATELLGSDTVPGPLYSSLPDNSWFRLLIIQPHQEFWAPIECRLQPISRDIARGKYEALSYAWNEEYSRGHSDWNPNLYEDPIRETPWIVCNGHEVPVKLNLWDALLYLRHPTRPRALWVDALCINQDDPAEVSHQIQAMTEIYGQASRTIVWLGTRPEPSACDVYEPLQLPSAEAAMALVCHVVKQWDASQPAKYFVTNPNTRTEEVREVDMNSRFARNFDKLIGGPWNSRYDLSPLQDLFRATWFGRKWVIQEVALSGSVEVIFCGCRISWRWMGLAAAILRTQYDNTLRHFRIYNVYHAYLMFRLSESNGLDRLDVSFPALLRLTADFQTSEPKDRFFSLLGLQTRDHHPATRPLFTGDQYHLSYPDLCTHIARAMLERGRHSFHPLSVLADAGSSGSRDMKDNVPTWVPNWRGNRPALLSPWSLDDRFKTDRGLDHYLDTETANRITVHGIHVSNVLRSCDIVIDSEDRVVASIDWLDQFPATLPLLQVYSRTLCAGRNIEGRRESDRNAMSLPLVAFTMYGMMPGNKTFDWINKCRKLLPEADQDPWKNRHKVTRTWNDRWVAARERFSCAARLVTPHRRLFLSSSGHLGLGPGDLSPGDEIWVLGGAATPFVLREGSDGAKILVGPCYIDDIMDGEAVASAKLGKRHLGPLWSEEFEGESKQSAPGSFDVRRVVIQ